MGLTTSQITDRLIVADLEGTIGLHQDHPEYHVLCVLEHVPDLEPSSAIHAPVFQLTMNGRVMRYEEIICPSHHGKSWYKHTLQELNEDKNSTQPGSYSVHSNEKIRVYAIEEEFKKASKLVSEWEAAGQTTIIHCFAAVERSPLFTAYHLFDSTLLDFNQSYSLVKQKHPPTAFRYEWLWPSLRRSIWTGPSGAYSKV
jgi:hypothetical protein